MFTKQAAEFFEQMATQMENMTAEQIMKSPNYLFRKDLQVAFEKAGISSQDAELICLNGEFALSHYDAKDPNFMSIIDSMTRMALVTKNKIAPLMSSNSLWAPLVKLSLKA